MIVCFGTIKEAPSAVPSNKFTPRAHLRTVTDTRGAKNDKPSLIGAVSVSINSSEGAHLWNGYGHKKYLLLASS